MSHTEGPVFLLHYGVNVTVSNTVLSGEPATPAVGGSPFRVSNAANLMSLPKFASQHTLWYRKVRALAPHAAAAYSFLFEDMILHRASEIDDPENSRERVLGELYSLFGIPVADQLCLFDRCSSARLRAAVCGPDTLQRASCHQNKRKKRNL